MNQKPELRKRFLALIMIAGMVIALSLNASARKPPPLPAPAPMPMPRQMSASVGFAIIKNDNPPIALEPGITIKTGDRMRAIFATQYGVYVYVLKKSTAGHFQVLHPNVYPSPSPDQVNPVKSSDPIYLPDYRSWSQFDDVSGVEQIYFIASIKPLAPIESFITQQSAGGAKSKNKKTHATHQILQAQLDDLFTTIRPTNSNQKPDPDGATGYNFRAIGATRSGPEIQIKDNDQTLGKIKTISISAPDLAAIHIIYKRTAQKDET